MKIGNGAGRGDIAYYLNWIELRCWNHLLGDVGSRPLEFGRCVAGVFEVLEDDAPSRSGDHVEGTAPLSSGLVGPFIDDELAIPERRVDVKAYTIVGGGVEGVAAGGGDFDLPRPVDRERIGTD